MIGIFRGDILNTPIIDNHSKLLTLIHAVTVTFSCRNSFHFKIGAILSESLIRRKLNVDRRQLVSTIKVLLGEAAAAGVSRFAKHLTASLTDEGIKLTLEQFKRSFGYKVEKIDDKSDIEASLKASEIRRGPSALRFRCLISDTTDLNDDSVTIIEGDYF